MIGRRKSALIGALNGGMAGRVEGPDGKLTGLPDELQPRPSGSGHSCARPGNPPCHTAPASAPAGTRPGGPTDGNSLVRNALPCIRILVPDLPIRITHTLPAIRPDGRVPPTGAPLPTQDDIAPTARGESALVSQDADTLLFEARLALRDVLPSAVHQDHSWAASLVQRHVADEHVRHVLQLHAGTARAAGGTADVRVHVHERYLSVAGVVGLLGDGAVRTGSLPLHTGRYVEVTLVEGGTRLATFWMPMVPVFRVSSRMVA